jgi:hypothetical protein
MSSGAERAALLERRRQLLEVEAGVQRATLLATLATWKRRRTLLWGAALGTAGATVLSRFKRKRHP